MKEKMKEKIIEQNTESQSKLDKAKDVIGLLSEVVGLVSAVIALAVIPKKDD